RNDRSARFLYWDLPSSHIRPARQASNIRRGCHTFAPKGTSHQSREAALRGKECLRRWLWPRVPSLRRLTHRAAHQPSPFAIAGMKIHLAAEAEAAKGGVIVVEAELIPMFAAIAGLGGDAAQIALRPPGRCGVITRLAEFVDHVVIRACEPGC